MKLTSFNLVITKSHVISVLLLLQIIFLISSLLDISLIRQFFGYIYLTLVPGFLIIKIIKIDKLNLLETILLSAGVSVSFVMFIAVITNAIGPYFGIDRPLSLCPLVCSISLTVIFLIFIFNRNCCFSIRLSASFIGINHLLFLILLVTLGILGTQISLNFRENLLAAIYIIILALYISILLFRSPPSENLYSLAIPLIALSLLFHISTAFLNLLIGWDVHSEFYPYMIAEINHSWDPNFLSSNVNSMLAVVILPNVYSQLLNINYEFIIKICYTLLFSLVPLGLYFIYSCQMNIKISFIATIFFIASSRYFDLMPSIPRQEIAELFLILLVWCVVEDKIDLFKKRLLILVFGVCLLLSHYSTFYLFMIFIFFTLFYMRLIGKKSDLITNRFFMVFIVIAYFWYTSTSNSSPFNSFINFFAQVIEGLSNDFLQLQSRESMKFIVAQPNLLLGQIKKYLYLISQLFIAIGFFFFVIAKFKRLLKIKEIIYSYGVLKLNCINKNMYIKNEYFSFSLIGFCALIASILLPGINAGYNFSRLYHFSLIFLSPFFVLGIYLIINSLIHILNRYNFYLSNTSKISTQLIAIILVLFILINTGLLNEISDQYPSSFPLSYYSMKSSDEWIAPSDIVITYESDKNAATWLSYHKNGTYNVYADYIASNQVLFSYGSIPNITRAIQLYKEISSKIPDRSYIFLRYVNSIGGIILYQSSTSLSEIDSYEIREIESCLSANNCIYNSNNKIFIKE